MAGKWQQVVQSERWQALDPEQRQAVRGAFFDRQIRPQTPGDKLEAVQSAFFTRTEPDVFGKSDEEGGGVGAMDYVKELGAGLEEGTGAVLQGAGDLLEQGGKWVDRGLRAIGLGDAVDVGDRALGGRSPSDAVRGAGEWFDEGGDTLRARQSEAATQAREDSTPTGDITKPSTWSMGEDPSLAGYGLQVSNLIGQFAPQAAALLAPGGQARAVGMASVGGLQAGGAAGQDAEQYVMQQSDEDLAKNSGMYRDLIDQGVEPAEAKRQTAVAARGAAFAGAAPVGGAGGALTHYILGPFQRAIGGGVGRRLGYGLAVDAPAEGAQEVAETVAGRTAQNEATQGNRDTTQGTFGDAALGAIAGGGHASLGAAMGETLPQRNRMPTPDDLVRERTPEDIAEAEQQYQRDRDDEARQWFERRRADEQSQQAAREQFGEDGAAVWQNADNDLPVRVRGIEPEPDEEGRQYARVEVDGQEGFVPLDELRATESDPVEESAAEPNPDNPRQPQLGIDNDIRVAERIGADEDAIRLRNAKSLFLRAMEQDAAGNNDAGSRLRERGLNIYRDIYGDPESPMPERPASFPVPYEYVGDVEAGGQLPVQAARQDRGETYSGEPDPALATPAPQLRQGDQATGDPLIYGQGPTVRRGNANTGLDQPFEGARTTDTSAEQRSDYDPTKPVDTPRHRRRMETSGRRATAYLADNTPVPVRYRVMDLDELTPSNDPDGAVNPLFPTELQPRDRTGKNSQVQVRNIAARLNPERLGESTDAGSGSPIVGPDGVVESGNGRTMAIAQAYRSDSPQARRYRDFVRQRAQDFGIDPGVVAGMRNPVLVRERTGSIDRAEFARRANEADVAGMTPHELAISDADRLSVDDLAQWAPDESGDPLAASNRAFARRFAQRMGNNEASRYRGRDGQPTPELGERMMRAVFAKGYADDQGRPSTDMVEMVAEPQGRMRNLTVALQSAAPDFAIAREYGGEQAQAMADTVVDAVRIVRQARSSGISVRELVSQNDAFSQPVPHDTAMLASFIANNARSRSGLNEALSLIAAATRNRAESSRNGSLFGDQVSNQDILDAATRQDSSTPDPERSSSDGAFAGGDRAGTGETPRGSETDRARAPEQTQEVDDPLLTTYTEQDIADRERANAASAQDEQLQRQAEAQRAQADRDAEGFTLTGSDRSADVAAAQGQDDLLDTRYAMRSNAGDVAPPTAEQVRAALDSLGERLGDFTVVDSAAELPLLNQLMMARDNVDPADVRGIYSGDRLYIVASNNDNIQQAVATAVHEAVGHKGIRGVLGDEIEPVMRQLYKSLPFDKRGREALDEVLADYPFLDRNNPDDQVTIAEEMVAHLLEKGYRPKAWQRAVAKIRELLRRFFPSVAWTYSDVLALGERSREYLRSQASTSEPGQGPNRYSRRGWRSDFPDAALAHPLRWATQHPDYEAAKAGDDQAALRLARDAVTPEFVEQVRQMIPTGSQPRIVPVVAQESAGRNRIPAMAAEVLAARLGLGTVDNLTQRERVSRTGANAMDRLQRQPTFDGDVDGGDFLLLDDTLTQGGTLAQLKTHIEDQGGRVLGVAALTGKQYSRKIAVDPSTLDQVRDRFGSVENQWRAAFGYGFEGLTQSEARTLLTFERGRLSPDELRNRIPALRDASLNGVGEGAAGDRSGPEAPLSDPSRYSLRPQRQPVADQFDDLSPEQQAFMAKFGPSTPTRRVMEWWKDLSHRAGLRIRQGMIDQYAALKELDEKRFGKDGALKQSITSSSWVLARMSNAANGALHAMLHNGRIYLDPDQKVIDIRDDDSKGLGAVLGRLGSPAEIERFMMWIAANRSSKLKDEGREFLFSDGEIRAGMQLDQGRMADGGSRAERYAEVFDEFQQYRDDVLAIAERAGVIRPDQRAMWRDEFYVPFYRLKDDKDVNVQLGTSGLSRQQAYKRLKGGTQNINDLLQNTMMNFHHLLDASLKNQAAQQAIDNAEAMGMARRVPESGRDTSKSTFVMKDGAKSFYEIDDPLVFQALSALAHPGMNNTIMKVMRGFKRVFTNLTTTTPQFMVANLIRDSLQAVATNEVSMNVFKNVYDGTGTLRDQRKRARMLAAGGSFNFGHLYNNNPDELRAQLTRNLRDAKIVGVPGSRLKGFAAPAALIRAGWAKWGDVTDFAENLNRAAIYDQNQDQGKLKAAFEARDLIDFSARGAWPAVRILTDIVPFLNARIQGLDKIYRSGVKPGANVLAAAFGKGEAGVSDRQAAARFWSVAGALTLATVALYLHNRDDEDYQKLEEWQKDTYWFFKVGDQEFFIPKPFEVGAIATMAERVTQQFVDDEATGALFGQRMMHMLTDTFSFSPVPQMMQPALDVYANRDSFTNRPIEGMGDERLSPQLRKRDDSSLAARGASWVLNHSVGAIGDPELNPMALSPLQIDYLIQGYLGQVGSWAIGSADVAWRVFDGKDEPAKHWYEYQPIRRFYRNLGDEPRYTRYGTVFYDGLREAERAYADVKELGELGRIEEARELAKNKADVLRLRKPLMKAQRDLGKIRAQMDAIRRSDLDGDLKRQRLDRLTAVRNRIQQVLGEKILEQRAAE
ncbi:LPD38 domain-containing protein [Salinicola peritrichatus]|uniref:LPD38 domain-containing protein n=1 Tax=Salinicola peritrichatus TaxID=1267424 RepID=UPI000DA15390|nr:LPD38 domain-containing protein [Salinicola peritrichatus]